MKELVAKRLVLLRGEKTRKAVASDIGVSVSALSMYENGHRMPKDETKARIAAYYGKTVGEIFFDDICHYT